MILIRGCSDQINRYIHSETGWFDDPYSEDLECEGVVEFGGVYAGCPKDAVSGQVQVLTEKLQHVQAALPPLEE